jgi:predicted NUDIX family NTP pyrophosphohydrolase
MAQLSAGLLMIRDNGDEHEFFLVHPGGPFYAKKDDGVWTIPKGLTEPHEDLLASARREFTEETGIVPHGELNPLGSVKLKSGKIVHAWMFRGEWNEEEGIHSNTFPLEWPPRSGNFIDVPEADRGGWFRYEDALKKINAGQQPLLTRAVSVLKQRGSNG